MQNFFFTLIVTLFLLGCEQNPLSISSSKDLGSEKVLESHILVGQKALIDMDTETVQIGENTYSVEIANTLQKRRKGLMNRKKLEKGSGMLFIFGADGMYPFWMKSTLIPLTIIWINEAGVVVDAQEATPCKKDPCSHYVPRAKAKYVLEINSGDFEVQ